MKFTRRYTEDHPSSEDEKPTSKPKLSSSSDEDEQPPPKVVVKTKSKLKSKAKLTSSTEVEDQPLPKNPKRKLDTEDESSFDDSDDEQKITEDSSKSSTAAIMTIVEEDFKNGIHVSTKDRTYWRSVVKRLGSTKNWADVYELYRNVKARAKKAYDHNHGKSRFSSGHKAKKSKYVQLFEDYGVFSAQAMPTVVHQMGCHDEKEDLSTSTSSPSTSNATPISKPKTNRIDSKRLDDRRVADAIVEGVELKKTHLALLQQFIDTQKMVAEAKLMMAQAALAKTNNSSSS